MDLKPKLEQIKMEFYVEDSDTEINENINEQSNSQIKIENVQTNQKQNEKQAQIQKLVDVANRIIELRNKNKALKKELTKKLNSILEARKFYKNLGKILTKQQMKKLKYPNKKIKWKPKDYASALSLYSALGSSGYFYMYRTGYPLPTTSSIIKFMKNIQLRPGILDSILQIMSNFKYNDLEKLCVLAIDEKEIESKQCKKIVYVIIIRSLFDSWSQPIYYQYDNPITINILIDIIVKLSNINFDIIAIVSNVITENLNIWKELGIYEDHPYFNHPCDKDKKIFIFGNTLHIMKLLRNYFLDIGFILDDILINSKPIKELLKLKNNNNIELTHNLTSEDLKTTWKTQYKISLIKNLFSHNVSQCLRKCTEINYENFEPETTLKCAYFIECFNNWYDLFDSKDLSIDYITTKLAYGVQVEEQKRILLQVSDIAKNLRTQEKTEFMAFQYAILLNNSSLIQLYEYLKSNYNNLTGIITSRLNLDIVENFFDFIRKSNASSITEDIFERKLKTYVVGGFLR